jgi:hypothetical protein
MKLPAVRRPFRLQLRNIIGLTAMLSCCAIASYAQDGVIIDPGGELPPAVSAEDPAIPTDQLELALKPLTVTELHSEMNAWQALVQEKVAEISGREIEVRKKNAEIAAQEEAAAAVAAAQEAAAEGKAVDGEALKAVA